MDYLLYILRKILRDPRRLVVSSRRWVAEARMDRRLGVSTQRREFHGPRSARGDSRPCQPVPYSVLEGIERHLQAQGFPMSTFIDVGCGTGRPLAYFSRLPFARMVGVEIDPAIAAHARLNLARLNPDWAVCRRIEVLEADALQADLPLPGAVVYLANPFGRATMQAFADRLKEQLRARPDQSVLLYYALPLQEGPLREAFPHARREELPGVEPCHVFHLQAEP